MFPAHETALEATLLFGNVAVLRNYDVQSLQTRRFLMSFCYLSRLTDSISLRRLLPAHSIFLALSLLLAFYFNFLYIYKLSVTV